MPNALITPYLSEKYTTDFSILISCLLCLLSILAALILTDFDKKNRLNVREAEQQNQEKIDLCDTPFKLEKVITPFSLLFIPL